MSGADGRIGSGFHWFVDDLQIKITSKKNMAKHNNNEMKHRFH